MKYTKKDILIGALVFPAGDLIASLITNDFMWLRLLGMVFIGAGLYAFEIPNYFIWIDRVTSKHNGFRLSMYKTGLSTIYFNPLWISRHMALIMMFSGNIKEISADILVQGFWSFIFSLPITIIGNYVVQNNLPLKFRFMGSALFSVIMAVYYALSMEYL